MPTDVSKNLGEQRPTEVFYNRKRQHSTLGYKSPVQFLQNWIRKHQEKLVA